jgi:hypothetical protein
VGNQINIEPKVTAVIEAAAKQAADEVNKIGKMSRDEVLKYEYENPTIPVNALGVLDHKFFEQIKLLTVWKDSGKLVPDYERTRELRALAYEGYERSKSSKPVPSRPISDSEILTAIQGRIQRASAPPEIVLNRHVHTGE